MGLGRGNEMERSSKRMTISESTKECHGKSGNEEKTWISSRVCAKAKDSNKDQEKQMSWFCCAVSSSSGTAGAPSGQAFG